MDITIILTVLGIVIAIIVGIWQIQLARKQIQISKEDTKRSPKSQGNSSEKNDTQPIFEKDVILKENPTQSVSLAAEKNKYRERPYPKEIYDEIEALPLFQRKQVQNNYVGLNVRWKTSLFHIPSVEENRITLALRDIQDRSGLVIVICKVDIAEYPELRIAKEGHGIWVEGQISSIESNLLRLENCKIKLD